MRIIEFIQPFAAIALIVLAFVNIIFCNFPLHYKKSVYEPVEVQMFNQNLKQKNTMLNIALLLAAFFIAFW